MEGIAIITIVLFGLITVFIILGMIYMARYRKVPPDKAMIVWGPFRKQDGYDRSVISGGGSFIKPIIEKYDFIPLDVRTLEIDVKRIPVTNPIPELGLNVKAVTQIKIASDENSVQKAVDLYLNIPDKMINETAIKAIEKALWDVVSTMSIEQVNSDRFHVSDLVEKRSREILKDLAIEVRAFVIKELDDDFYFLDSLGFERTAEVVVNASGFLRNTGEPSLPNHIAIEEPPEISGARFFEMGDYHLDSGRMNSAMRCYGYAVAFCPDNMEYRMAMEAAFEGVKQRFINKGYSIFHDPETDQYQASYGPPVNRLLSPEELEMRRAGLPVGEGPG